MSELQQMSVSDWCEYQYKFIAECDPTVCDDIDCLSVF